MRLLSLLFLAGTALATSSYFPDHVSTFRNIQVGPRPFYLVEDMDDSSLKSQLSSCSEKPVHYAPTFSISHRGAPLQFPEHSREGMLAAARQGAGIIECDVTFTKDHRLVCRHSQCDLHTTTNILTVPSLAAKCTEPFSPASHRKPAAAKCCTSDITLAEFKSLCAKMDSGNASAVTPEDYQHGRQLWRTELYNQCGTLVEHTEYIKLIDSLGLQFSPELKAAETVAHFNGNNVQEAYAQQLIDDYKNLNISPSRVWPQSFSEAAILYWIQHEPDFGKQAVYLDQRVDTPSGYAEAVASLSRLQQQGVRIMAPPIFALLNTSSDGEIISSEYARAAKDAGLSLFAWSLERSGPIKLAAAAGDYYIQSIAGVLHKDGDIYRILDALVNKAGVKGIFSDWPGTVTYYANCMGLW